MVASERPESGDGTRHQAQESAVLIPRLCTYGVWRDIHVPSRYEAGYSEPIGSMGDIRCE